MQYDFFQQILYFFNIYSLPYILGSSPSIIVAFKIENTGETAYLARIRIVLPIGVHFTKTPSNCKLDLSVMHIMECDIARGIPMFRNSNATIKIGIDTTRLEGKELIVKANVFSAGDEQNELDNHIESVIALKEFSNIEVIRYLNKKHVNIISTNNPISFDLICSDSSKKHLKSQSEVERENLTHIFEVRFILNNATNLE